MSVRKFTSESYAEVPRHAAWQDFLGMFGLRSTLTQDGHGLHALALLRGTADGGASVARLAASAQTLSPLANRTGAPLLLIPLEDDAELISGGAAHPIPARHIALLPRQGDWAIGFVRDIHAVALSLPGSLFQGRKLNSHDFGEARIIQPGGLASILVQTLDAAAQSLETLSPAEWATIEQSLAAMLMTLVHQPAGGGVADAGSTAAQAALLHRICQTIERRLDDPNLGPARVAQIEGISERYLQKLFETAGNSFSHFLRERRLYRTKLELANPAEAHQSVSEIAYRCGFNDAAHFSRAFRERFGVSPRLFRQQEAERAALLSSVQGQRGWPLEALAQPRGQRSAPAASPGPSEAAVSGRPASAHPAHHHLQANAANVHWGFFSRTLAPRLEIKSGDRITIETLTQHASDDPERMITGDSGAESVFRWTQDFKGVDRRGAGPLDASIFGRGAGEGFGVHICTGPVAIADALPGDVLEVRLIDIVPRPSRNPTMKGKIFGSSVAAWWGYHYSELLAEPKPRETVTIYEIVHDVAEPYAQALYSYVWEAQTDPFGAVHKTYDYPGVLVAPNSVTRRLDVLDGIKIPLRPHFGVIGVAPKEMGPVDSVPPSYFGGNIDNWRIGKGSAVYLPVSVPGALLSIGDPHATQGDGEIGGTAIECSMTGTFEVVLHKKASLAGQPFADLTYPLIETPTGWVLTGYSHPNYLAEFGAKGQSEVYATSSLDLAMKDAFRKVRRFLMNSRGLREDEAIALMSAAVDFGVTQVVDGNWGVHAIIGKQLLER